MSETVVNQGTLDRLRSIMRRDLKLGPHAELPRDLPLIGGDFDLDSLDMLMLVTSIEKEFGVKVTEGAVGRESFRTLETLARFVEWACTSTSAGD